MACNFSKSNPPSKVLFTFFKLYKWYQIEQRITYFQLRKLLFFFSESDNKWKGASLIEYQRRIFQKEVNDLKRQIGSFCEIWITKLDSMQVKHDEQLDSVQKWLKKVGAHFSLLSQKSVTHQTFTSSNSTNETLQKGVENVHS